MSMNREKWTTGPEASAADCAVAPRRIPEVEQALDVINEQITRVAHTAAALIERLTPVMSPTTTPCRPSKSFPEFTAPLPIAIINLADRIQCVSEQIEDAHDRLEV